MTHPNDHRPDIAIFLPTLAGGGAERVAVRLANSFSERGLDIDLVCGSLEGPYLEDVGSEVRTIDLAVPRFRYALLPLIRYLRRSKPQRLLSLQTQANLVALLARRFSRHPGRLVISERVSITGVLANPEAPWVLRAPRLMRWLYPRADAVIAVSEGVAGDLVNLIGLPLRRVHVIHNPIDIDSVRRAASESPGHPWLDDDETPVVVGVGRLVPSKDFSTLIRAIATANASHPVRLVLLGEGPERKRLETLTDAIGMKAHVQFLGFVRNPYAIMARADVVASTSLVEGFPNGLVEALALGRKIVATDCDTGPAEVLDNGSYGALVDVGDEERLAIEILHAIRNPVDSGILKERAEKWNTEHIVDLYEAVMFKRTIEGRRG